MSLVDPKKLLEDLQTGKNITRLEHNYICGLLKDQIDLKEMKEEGNFKDYRDLPFPTEIQDLLMKYHIHGEDDKIIYEEGAVIAMLKVLKNTINEEYR